MHLEELWTGATFEARAARTLLTPFSWIYAASWETYLAMYRLGLKKPVSPHHPILCIGNLQSGGTGKTPTVIHVADVLSELGREVVISCSGYGSPGSEGASKAPWGLLRTDRWGDEAALIRTLRPDVPLIVGRRRVAAAEICRANHPSAVLLLDDGFQHLPLGKDLSIVLDPPVPNRRCLPAGPYREPLRNRRRADLVIPGEFTLAARPLTFRTAAGEQREAPDVASLLCALARPMGFVRAVEALGIEVRTQKLLQDHDPLSAGNLLEDLPKDLPIIVSGKDWVKLRERDDIDRYDFAVAGHEVVIEPRESFKRWLEVKLNAIQA